MLSRDEFREVAVFDQGCATYEVPVSLTELIDAENLDAFNDLIADDFVEDGFLLADLTFIPLRVEGDSIIIQVTANAEEWEAAA